MSTQTTEGPESGATSGRTEPERSPWPGRISSAVARYAGGGTAPALAGGLLLAGAAIASRKSARRAGILGLVGTASLVVGLRRRWSADRSTGDGELSAEAEAHRDRSDAIHQSETNPRGVSGEPDVEARTDPEGGDVRFSADRVEGTAPKPDLDGSAEGDPRRPDEDDPETPDHVEVDLSEAAMADEASEATGPDPEQAYPAMEGTDPEPTSSAAPDEEAERAEEGGEEGAETGIDDADEGSSSAEDDGTT